MTDDKPPIVVLGAGSWGTALGILLARNGYPARLWGNDKAQLERIERERQNDVYLPGIRFPDDLHTAADLTALTQAHRQFLIAVPSHAFREVLTAMQPHLAADAILAWATKGLEPGTGKLLSQAAAEVLGGTGELGVISGPSFAREVAMGLPTALTVAAEREETAQVIAQWLRNPRLRVYTSGDMAGVQLGGAIKNVIAIAAGVSDGLSFGANARAALITRGLAELTRLGVAMGGKPETFMGLAGAGDLILTCTDDTSRNRRLGLGLGQGRNLAAVLAAIGQEVEGVATARELYHLALKRGVEVPITEQVYRVLYEGVPPQEAVETLLRREPKQE